jgi:UDP:flavonoid glycosyltransferase YjiC (YdhE family)
MESEDGQRWLAAGNASAFMKELSAIAHASWDRSIIEAEAACQGADLVVAGLLAEELADIFTEYQGVPLVTMHHCPQHRNSAYPHPLVTTRRLPGPLNSATGALFERVWWRGLRRDIGRVREELGLPGVSAPALRRHRERRGLSVQAYDAALVPRLRSTQHEPLVGFLTLDQELRAALVETGVDGKLDAWLAAGEPPVFFGFGSMPVRDPAATVMTITEVATRVGIRALVSAGWGRLAALDPGDASVTVVGALDHDAVLPRCRAAVHHGGAGTTAASLEAGLPTVVCSVFADQPFWGARIVDLRVGAHLRFQDLSAETLEAVVRTAVADDTRDRACMLGERLRSSHGAAARAADAIEARVAGS